MGGWVGGVCHGWGMGWLVEAWHGWGIDSVLLMVYRVPSTSGVRPVKIRYCPVCEAEHIDTCYWEGHPAIDRK
jgi:hypothetical protein